MELRINKLKVSSILVLLLLLSFTFIPFGIDAEAAVNAFNDLTTQTVAMHQLRGKALAAQVENVANDTPGNGNTIVLTFPLEMKSYIQVNSFFGEIRPGDPKPHTGTDLGNSATEGSKLYACIDGVIAANRYSESWGNTVAIYDSVSGLYFRYAHMMRQSGIPIGAKVKRGDVIGYAGSTGEAGGPHLHFEIYVPAKGAGEDIASEFCHDAGDPKGALAISKFKLQMLPMNSTRYDGTIFSSQVLFLPGYPVNLKLESDLHGNKDYFGNSFVLHPYKGG